MSTFLTFIKLLAKPKKMFRPLATRGIFKWMSDEAYLRALYYCELDKTLDLQKPEGFNAKIQWLKLYDRNPEYSRWVDKETAKEMAGEKIGYEHVVPLISSWHSPDDIDFNKLPEKCVLKCNHDQGSTIFIDRKKGIKELEIKKHFSKCLKKNTFIATREWPYKSIEPKIICEPFLEEDIIDYKFFCFNGVPDFVNIGQKTNNDHVMHISFV